MKIPCRRVNRAECPNLADTILNWVSSEIFTLGSFMGCLAMCEMLKNSALTCQQKTNTLSFTLDAAIKWLFWYVCNDCLILSWTRLRISYCFQLKCQIDTYWDSSARWLLVALCCTGHIYWKVVLFITNSNIMYMDTNHSFNCHVCFQVLMPVSNHRSKLQARSS